MTLLTLLSPAILLAGTTIGFFYFRHLTIIQKAITIYVLVMLLVDFASRIFEYYFHHNLIVLLFYSLIEACMFIYFYFKLLFKLKHRFILLMCLANVLYILWELFTYRQIEAKSFQSYAKVADNSIVIMLVLTYFYENINRFKDSKWNHFTLNIIILIFFSLTLLFFLPFNFIINNSGLQFYFWMGILVATVLFYIYLTILISKNAIHKNKVKV